MTRHAPHIKIYKKRWHLSITFLVIVLPFLFIFIFSRLTGVQAQEVFVDLGASTLRVFVAYIFSVIIAFLSVLFLAQGRLGDFFLPVFDVLQSFPSFALLPLFTLWFGVGSIAAIFFLTITIIWPILFSTLSSIRTTRQDLEEAAFIFGARGFPKFFSYTVPISLPGLITGSIVGLGEGWEAIVGAEIIGITPGIGGFLNAASVKGDIPVLAFGVMALLIFLFSLNKLVWLPLLRRSHEYSHE